MIEILNVDKDSKKIVGYISKFFDKIDKEKKITSDIADVLRSLTIDYQEKKILTNQETILKRILVQKSLIKFYFAFEEKKDLKELIAHVKHDKMNKTFFEMFNSQIKIVELLALCAKENLFCTMNCRIL
eukprot:CAMPEP_0170534094 /NCGR_PEP_ID=MMETSP0209-20121228/88332_1 /TAXON_ID=665100 ORGANISM="Litonotus pictus, Strain P1" /NCGR_SAMPLE_ID=MMETSP0209 /ASSEMBLY_ACC=CAM_ASM_000301 /LENGTH=128 /DNA_ID=CAMNT_0010832945 /DNA_START=8 /DNA_END=390 /DNA_ORIENTATION=-